MAVNTRTAARQRLAAPEEDGDILHHMMAALEIRRSSICGWPYAAPASALTFAALLATELYIYRTVQFMVTFALT
jgi:hypothetical protein